MWTNRPYVFHMHVIAGSTPVAATKFFFKKTMYFVNQNKRDFNDLIIERVLSMSSDEAEKFLGTTFPTSAYISIFTDRGGNTVIEVDDIQFRVKM